MGIYSVKPKFREMLRKAAESLATRGVTPDQVTTAGLGAGMAGGIALAGSKNNKVLLALVPVMAFARITANALDGLVAEVQGSGRPAGELYNETADRLSDAAFFAGAAVVEGVSPALAFGALSLSELASFIGVASKAAGSTRRYDGPMGKPDRMFVLGGAALAGVFSKQPHRWLNTGLGVIAAGASATAWNRYTRAHGLLESGTQTTSE